MKVKIKSVIKVEGTEELIVIPLNYYKNYVLGLNFFEDIPNGRLARFVIIIDRYGELNDKDVVMLKGKKGYVETEGVNKDFEILEKYIRIERKNISSLLPLLFDIEVTDIIVSEERGVRGYFNYINKYGNINFKLLKGLINFTVEEIF
jgi:hypothetical protein